ncbi:hypothetical protein BD311DRAFT_759427 [Dichomitus squalens]|uniref:Uncharacterized protein n=1 Tax=Dichomitus squalens TaxID=114155 RepID=A0A4Q9MNU4_9APHY|nr:hypothetical protein BD311DRAFT_759427 [Dichomitus squalens]
MSATATTTAGLSAASAKRLRTELTTLAEHRVFPVVVETALFAIFTIIILTSTYILFKRGIRKSRPNVLMLSATLAMYAISTLDWAIDIRLLWNDLHTLTLTGVPVSHPPFGVSDPALLVLQGITSVICIILGDAVVCWRVSVVWGSDRRVVAGALFWVLGSIGVFTAWSAMFVGFYYDHLPAPVEVLVHHSTIVNAFAFSWSAATNVWATAMVAYKAWLQRRDLRRHLGSTGLAVHDVLMLLVDLGIIYTVFMLLNVIVLAPSLNGGKFFSYVTLFMQQITGMYPTALIVLVALQKSHLDHQFTYPPTTHDRSSEIESLPFTVKAHHPKDAEFGDTTDTYASASTGYGYERDAGMTARVMALHAPTDTSEPIWEIGKDSSAEDVALAK